MTTIQTRITQAWQDMKTRIDGSLATSIAGAAIPDFGNAADLNVCYTMNPVGVRSQFIWEDGGTGAISLGSLTVSTFTGAACQPAAFPSDLQVILPVGFSSLAVTGRFAFSQPCVQYDVDTNKQQATTNYTGAGSVTYSSSSGQIGYVAAVSTLAGGAIQLTLQGVNVTGTQDTQVSLDGSSDDLFSKIFSYLQTAPLTAIQGAIQNVFTTAQLTAEMIMLLNNQLSGAKAARA